jgi:hypothetical protein
MSDYVRMLVFLGLIFLCVIIWFVYIMSIGFKTLESIDNKHLKYFHFYIIPYFREALSPEEKSLVEAYYKKLWKSIGV